ncbi:nucleic-acid-binding protein from transposon X-element [Trichonephila clavipes]|nr:nucleic-acid-binding protein from transposon X-element [Trichonephila clavipes]
MEIDFRRVAARLSTMEVDSPDDDENHSPCYQRLKLKGKIATVQMRLKTFHDLQATFNTSNPSLMETTSAAAAEQQVKLDALVSERDSLLECLTFNCQFCNNSNPTTPVEVNAPIKNKNSHINKKAKTDKNINKTPVNDKNKTAKIENTNDLTVDQNQVIEEKEAKIADIPNPRPLQPIHLKITKNFRNQIKSIYQKFPETTNKTSGKFIKLFSKDVEEKHNLTKFLESDKDFEFFCIKPKLDKPIKVVIKGLPIYTKTQEIHSDLEEEGFTVEKVSQFISKKHRGPLPFFLITLPRNASNSKIFDIKTLGYLQVRVEGFLVRGITQCYNCNNFFHTVSECRLKPRCLKCGKEHPTKQCPIKERQENPFCINCKELGHSACYTKCPLFPKPKKGATLPMISKTKINKCKEGITYANVVSGSDSAPIPTPNASEKIQQCECKNSSKGTHGIIQDNTSDLAQPSSTPLDPFSETPPTIKYQVATPSQPQYKIEDGGINRFQFLVQYSSRSERSVPLLKRERRLQESPTATRRSFQARFNVPKGPDAKTIRTLFAKFQRTGSVTDNLVGNVGRKQTAVTPQNVATVSGIIQQNPMSSIRRTASEAGLKRSSTQKILRKSLHMFPFKIQTHHAVPVRAVQQRDDFANQMLTMIDSDRFDVGCI